MIKYVGPVVIYKIIDLHNYLLMTLDGKILRGLFAHERLKPANIRANQGNIHNHAQLKQVMDVGFKIWKYNLRLDSIISKDKFKYAFAHKENTQVCAK